MKSESENLRGNKKIKNSDRGNNFEVEKVGRKNSIIWNLKRSKSVRVDTNRTNLIKTLPENSTKIGSIPDSDTRSIE